jgi:hypothetical protein
MSSTLRLPTRLIAYSFCGLLLAACGVQPAPPSAAETASQEEVEAASLLAAAPNCPTASESLPLNLLFWRSARVLDGFKWSNDGSQILGIETRYEEKQTWSPLWGLKVVRRKYCHQLFWTALDSAARQNIGGPSELQVVDALAFPQAGYIVIGKHSDSSPWIYERVALDGSRRQLASISGACDWSQAVPSPDGSTIAYAHTVLHSCPDPTLSNSTTTVSFFDAAGSAIGSSGQVTLAGYARSTWTPAGAFVVTDGATASAVAVDGTVSATAVPGCTDPPSTSSNVDATGRLLDIHDGKPAVVGVDPGRAFGCQ